MIEDSILSIWKNLDLHGATTVIIFDGRNPGITDEQWQNYQNKINKVKNNPKLQACHVEENTEWLHQANGLRNAMQKYNDPNKPIIFSIQDDTVILPDIDNQLILSHLLEDPKVEYIRLWYEVFTTDQIYSSKPFTEHPETHLLHETNYWSDRPHWALKSHYDTRVWPSIESTNRGTMEQSVQYKSVNNGWGLWIYGNPNDIIRERHSQYAPHNGENNSSYFINK